VEATRTEAATLSAHEKFADEVLVPVNTSVLQRLQVTNIATQLPAVVIISIRKQTALIIKQPSCQINEVFITVIREKFEFIFQPQQNRCIINQFSEKEQGIISQEIQKILAKGAIVEYRYEPYEFISPIFLHPKPDGSHRLILNMKSLNTYVHKECI
jgi:hypothetical protein